MFLARWRPSGAVVFGLLLIGLSACTSADTSPATTAPPVTAPTLFASATPQLRMQREGGQIMLTVLGDDMLHIAYAPSLQPGQPYFSPLLDKRQFAGPSMYQWDAEHATLITPGLRAEADGSCWRISDLRQTPARVMTRLCVEVWTTRRLKLGLSAEGHSEILGLGQHLSAALTAPSWLGQRREPGNAMGNAMTYSDIAASGNTQVPVAYVLGQGLANYGLFFDTPFVQQFDFNGPTWTVDGNKNELGLFIFGGTDLKSLRRKYLELSGRPPVPPLKAFGLWISEYGYDNWAELDDKLATLRSNDFPIDGAVLDLQWFGGILSGSENTSMGKLAWDTQMFPDAAAKLATYASSGLGIASIEESYVGSGLPEHGTMAEQRFLAMDCPAPCTSPVLLDGNAWWGIGGMLDWSNPGAGRWWHDNKRSVLINDGILWHWTDLGEPEQYQESGFYHGFDWYGGRVNRHRDIHNLYNFFWSRSNAEETARTHPQRRPWVLSRSGTAGSQRYGVAMWSGDVASSFGALGAQMRAQANMSWSGFDYYGSDVGGFQRQGLGGAPLNNLYTRWFASSALLDIPLRPHVMNLCNCTETAPDRIGDKNSNLAALRLRYQLVPYLYSLAHAAWTDGDAVFPPLSYYFQSDSKARAVSGTKMMGPWLLFVPPVAEGDLQDVYLPQGRWTDFYHSERKINSTGSIIKQAALDGSLVRAPLFLRSGAIVPMLRVAPPNLGDPRSGSVHWFSDLLIRAVPSSTASRFVLVEDDGISRAYQTGKTARTTLDLQQTGAGQYRFAVSPDNRTGQHAMRSLTLELLTGAGHTGTVTVNGQVLPPITAGAAGPGWYASAGGTTLHLGAHAVDEALEVMLSP